MSHDEKIEGIAELSAETIRNAINVEIKQRFGEEYFVRSAMVIALVERPRRELDKPNTPRVSLFLKSLVSVHPSIAINMLKEAAAVYQGKRAESGDAT
ncbi:hypothetical protein QLT00_gp19 [Gordonia phage Commandaria]|uniref:Uncharacterized protein n=1 Tax=Gordonia phage Commandaria TaxID=3038364 RepID=A0AAF0GIF1_9CAUD|nr:hypothetical protein QLT00_gp19 [Gordonia phage Commandaria]WGH20802.1 hypothetical protein [Gordonia phage Commandaria]